MSRWLLASRRATRRLSPLEPADRVALHRTLAGLARDVGLRDVHQTRVDRQAAAPYVTGLFRARLVLPFDWRHWPADTLNHALGHELTHLRRGDLRAEALWMSLVLVYWFHPLVHIARWRAHEAREMCCDMDAAGRLGPAYRLTLLRMLAAYFDEPFAAAATPGRHGWHPAIARLRALERWPVPARGRRRMAMAMLVAGLVILPAKVAVVDRADAAVTVDRLIDPASRQALGLGSLHLRYALMGAGVAGPPVGAPARTEDK
jgi:beta-lactamase regulating signal transducer with metallopeptidase domain